MLSPLTWMKRYLLRSVMKQAASTPTAQGTRKRSTAPVRPVIVDLARSVQAWFVRLCVRAADMPLLTYP